MNEKFLYTKLNDVKKPSFWIEACKIKNGRKLNDMQLADLLKIPRSAFSQYKNDKHAPSILACIKMAVYLEISPMTIIVASEAFKKKVDREWNETVSDLLPKIVEDFGKQIISETKKHQEGLSRSLKVGKE